MRVYPKISELATWSENCKWYSSLPLGAVVSLFCKSAAKRIQNLVSEVSSGRSRYRWENNVKIDLE
jgi:hypothetical protein